MQTKEFLSLLKEHPNKSLLFEYRDGHTVGANYHITEVKNITVDSVDCGAGTDFWKETVIQLWESPTERDKKDYMSAYKALGILKKVNGIKPLNQDTELKFEYSNAHFHTAQLFVNDIQVAPDRLLLKLGVEKTDCKAKETCGVAVGATEEACCDPASGCC
ncbi:DUF6428 family protein [Flavobacteriaceae bacterium 3-367]